MLSLGLLLSTIFINTGGTYSGGVYNEQVQINTTQPVTLKNCIFNGGGLYSPTFGAQVTVYNCKFNGATATVPAIKTFKNKSLNVSNSTFIGWSQGINVIQDSGDNPSVSIIGNDFQNLQGKANFVGLNTLKNVSAKVKWNKMVNTPFQGYGEDLISTYCSDGNKYGKIYISDNYIQGANNATPATVGTRHSGAGINIGDCGTNIGNVVVRGNTVVDFGNDGIALTGGHDNDVFGNRILSGQFLFGTSQINQQIYRNPLKLYNYYNGGYFYNNSIHDNYVNVLGPDGNKAYNWAPSQGGTNTLTTSPSLGKTGVEPDVSAELTLWTDKANAAGYTRIGACF